MPVGDHENSSHDGGEPCGGVVELRGLADDVQRFLKGFDPAVVHARDAAAMVPLFVQLENLGAAGKALAADRVAGTDLWQTLGFSSMAAYLASLDGTSVGEAVAVLQTAEAMSGLDATTDTFKSGKLSRRQANAVATAAKADPGKENELLNRAAVEPVTGLEKKAREIRLAASPETVEERHARAHKERRVTTWEDGERGYGRWELPLSDHALLMADLEARRKKIFRQANSEGRREPDQAYLADALVSLVADGSGRGEPGVADGHGDASRPGAGRRSAADIKVIVRVDDSALQRGVALEGELCEIAGVGAIPVSVVREWVEGDAFKAAIVADGVDIRAVVNLGRKATALQRTALDWINVGCCVVGCNRTARLEIDHSQDWATTLQTILDDIDRMCGHDHDLKTYRGWTLGPRQPDGTRHLTPPPDTTGPDPGGTPEAPPPPDTGRDLHQGFDDPDDGPRPLGLFDTS